VAFIRSAATDAEEIPEKPEKDKTEDKAPTVEQVIRLMDDAGRREAEPVVRELADWRAKSFRKDVIYA
jgi:hypothetical protein